MNRLLIYIRLQYKLLILLFFIITPIAGLSLAVIGLELLSTQVLLFGILIFLRIGFVKIGPDFLQLDLKQYVQKKIKRVPSTKDLIGWQNLNREAQDAIFILVGLGILALRLIQSLEPS